MSVEVTTKDTDKKSIYPATLKRFFRKPPLLLSESNIIYEDLYRSTATAMDPQNDMEWLLHKDFVDLSFELSRLGNDRASIVNMNSKAAIRMLLESLLGDDPDGLSAQGRADAFFTDEGRMWVLDQLRAHGLNIQAITAQAATMRRPELECIDRQMERVRAARVVTLREYAIYRQAGTWKGPNETLAIVDAKANPASLAPALDPGAIEK
jgi:hypothetical protein